MHFSLYLWLLLEWGQRKCMLRLPTKFWKFWWKQEDMVEGNYNIFSMEKPQFELHFAIMTSVTEKFIGRTYQWKTFILFCFQCFNRLINLFLFDKYGIVHIFKLDSTIQYHNKCFGIYQLNINQILYCTDINQK